MDAQNASKVQSRRKWAAQILYARRPARRREMDEWRAGCELVADGWRPARAARAAGSAPATLIVGLGAHLARAARCNSICMRPALSQT